MDDKRKVFLYIMDTRIINKILHIGPDLEEQHRAQTMKQLQSRTSFNRAPRTLVVIKNQYGSYMSTE